MNAPRHSGTLVLWIEADGFGEIRFGEHDLIVVYREALASAGLLPAKRGTHVTFEIGATHKGNTGAIAVEGVPQRVAPVAPRPVLLPATPAPAVPTQ